MMPAPTGTSVTVRELAGLAGTPSDRTAAGAWLKKQGISTERVKVKGGLAETVNLSDLPEPVRLAYTERQIAASGLEAGIPDEAAHRRFITACRSMRDKAEHKAAVARFLVSAGKALTWPEKTAAVARTFGAKGNSEANLKKLLSRVEGVYPANFAPALLGRHKGSPKTAEICDDDWAAFVCAMAEAHYTHSEVAAYNDVRRMAGQQGRKIANRATFRRRSRELPVADWLTIRFGPVTAAKMLYQSQRRELGDMQAMEWVSLDGGEADTMALWPDGYVGRPLVLGLVDQASGKVLDIEIDKTENSAAVARLEIHTFRRFGSPDNLLTDNGAAFSGHIHAGQVGHKWRNKGNRKRDLEPPGLHKHLGFKLHFALPENAQSKLMERKYRDFRTQIDTSHEFKGAHTGNRPDRRPDGKIAPLPIAEFEKVYRARIAAYHAQEGRRSQGAKATDETSYDAIFAKLSEGRAVRVLAEFQLRMATLEWCIYTVQEDGRVRGAGEFLFGDDLLDNSQDPLLLHKNKRVWVGTNPFDRSQPAIVWDPVTDAVICWEVHEAVKGKFNDKASAEASAKRRTHARKLTRKVTELQHDEARANLRASLDLIGDAPAPELGPVVRPHFDAPIRRSANASFADTTAPAPAMPSRMLEGEPFDQGMQNAREALNRMMLERYQKLA